MRVADGRRAGTVTDTISPLRYLATSSLTLVSLTKAAYMTLARRKIHDVHVRHPTAIPAEALKRIGDLYAIESENRGSPANVRLSVKKAERSS